MASVYIFFHHIANKEKKYDDFGLKTAVIPNTFSRKKAAFITVGVFWAHPHLRCSHASFPFSPPLRSGATNQALLPHLPITVRASIFISRSRRIQQFLPSFDPRRVSPWERKNTTTQYRLPVEIPHKPWDRDATITRVQSEAALKFFFITPSTYHTRVYP